MIIFGWHDLKLADQNDESEDRYLAQIYASKDTHTNISNYCQAKVVDGSLDITGRTSTDRKVLKDR